MSTNFPTSLDSLSNPSSGNTLNSPSHSTQHANANDAIEVLEAKVGIDNSAVTTSHDYKIRIYNPIGEITMWATSTAPAGWLIADGSAISRSTYSALFGVLSTTYGVGDGSTTFNLPNLKGRFPIGKDSSDIAFDAIGETGGSKVANLAAGNLPAHTHTVDSNTLDMLYNAGGYTTGYITGRDADNNGVIDGTTNTFGIAVGSVTDHTHTISSSGGNGTTLGNAFNIIPPYITLNFIIRF
jgi:microcystin-dependent protein